MKHKLYRIIISIVFLMLFNSQYTSILNANNLSSIISISDNLLLTENFTSPDPESNSSLVVPPFSEDVIFAKLPSSESEAELRKGLRAGPDLGGDIDGGGNDGIGREIPISPLSGFALFISTIAYFLVWMIRTKQYPHIKNKVQIMIKRFVLPLCLVFFFSVKIEAQSPPIPVAGALYVRATANGSGDGSDWNNAFDGRDLAWYLKNVATDNTVIYLAEGVYLPFRDGIDTGVAREYSFELIRSIQMYGGFNATATGTDLSSYAPMTNITRLSGDIGIPNDTADNSYNVVKVIALTGTLVDGFHISGANGFYTSGGGVSAPNTAFLTLSNSVVEDNFVYRNFNPAEPTTIEGTGGYGAGIYANYANISDCIVRRNRSAINGGGIYSQNTLTLNNTTVSDNRSGGTGAGILVGGNVTFKGDIAIERNAAESHGGAMYIATATFNLDDLRSLRIVDCISGANGPGTTGNGGALVFNGIAHLMLDGSKADITISGNTGARGGAISLNQASSVTFRNLTMKDNVANISGGAINAAGGPNSTCSVILENVTFENNTAPSGGAVYSNTYNNNPAIESITNIDKCTFIKNYSRFTGGAVYLTVESNANVRNSTFSENEARGVNPSTNSTNPGGGAAIKIPYNAAGLTPNVKNIILCTFNGNIAINESGHAIDIGYPEEITLIGNVIYGNGVSGTEISLDPQTAIYNVERGSTLLNSTNLHVASGKADSIFTDIASGDLAILANNGTDTKVYDIIRNGFAYNLVPSTILSGFGLSTTDQRNQQRLFSCKIDAGSVELQEMEDPMTYDVGTGITCPDSLFNANELITSKVFVKKIEFYSDAALTIPVTMPIAISLPTTIYARVTSTSNCDSDETLQINLFARESTWTNSGNDSDWNNSTNWSDGIPGPCTNVIVPSGKNNYPILSASTAAECDTIDFKFGGEVARTHFLEYNSAKIDLTLNANQWYLLSPVLQQQYSGDYIDDQSQYRLNPEIFIMYYQTGNPQTGAGKVVSKFTGLFNTTDELLKMTSGHAIWIDEGNRPESQFTLHFPKDSIRYAYYNKADNKVTRFSNVMARDKSNRFIYEGNPTYDPSGDRSFSQSIDNSDLGSQIIVGNPYMSHLDVVEFQRENDPYLMKSFQIWKSGTSYESYLIDVSGNVIGTSVGAEDGFQIPPMQSFIIGTKLPFTAPLLFTPVMSITQPGKTVRSSAERSSIASNVINLEILREGVRQSGLAIQYKAGESSHYNQNKDVWTVIPESFGSYVSMYSLVDGNATSIHTTGDIGTPISLNVSVGSTVKNSINKLGKEIYTIQMAGSNKKLAGRDVYMIDTEKNITHNLTQSAYVFENKKGDVTGRFRLFTDTSSSIETIVSDKYIDIQYRNNQIKVTAENGDIINTVDVYDVLGKQLYSKSNIEASEWSIDTSLSNRMVIVKVQTKNSSKTEKVIIR